MKKLRPTKMLTATVHYKASPERNLPARMPF